MRRLDFDGCFNFRDLGGWRTADGRSVAWNRLYRADSVHLMSEGDVVRARDELGVRTLIDLRNDIEITVGGIGALSGVVAARHHAPLTSRREPIAVDTPVAAQDLADRSPDRMVPGYLGTLEVSSDLIVNAVETFAREESLPAVFFCAAGKDRTGVLSAVVLGALGVRDEDIVEDYVLSAETIDQVIGRFAATDGAPAMYRDLPASHFAPVAETMQRVIAGVHETYGSFARYLEAKGLARESLDALKESLLTSRA